MAIERFLTVPSGYDPTSNPRVASFAAQLDDQFALLKRTTTGMEPAHLEWQPHPGVNTVGMLLAHLAVVDVWWIRIAPHNPPKDEHDRIMRDTIGILMDDDGLPLPPDGKHPASLRGKTLEDYYRMLDSARAVTHQELRAWRDADLGRTYTFLDRIISHEWTAYHVLEHFAAHSGQVLLLRHMMWDAGVLPRPEKK